MIFKKLERWSPRFLSSELGRKIKGTPSIFSPGCKDFVLQYVTLQSQGLQLVFRKTSTFFLVSCTQDACRFNPEKILKIQGAHFQKSTFLFFSNCWLFPKVEKSEKLHIFAFLWPKISQTSKNWVRQERYVQELSYASNPSVLGQIFKILWPPLTMSLVVAVWIFQFFYILTCIPDRSPERRSKFETRVSFKKSF